MRIEVVPEPIGFGEETDRLDEEGLALLKWLVCGFLFTIAAFVVAPIILKALQ